MEVGCLECPNASTFCSQPQHWVTPPWLAQHYNPAMSPHAQETKNRHPSHWKNSGKKKGGKGGDLDDNCSRPHWLTESPRTARPTPHEWNTAPLRMRLKTDLWPRHCWHSLLLKAHLHPRLIAVICFCFESLYCPNAWSHWLNGLKLFEKGHHLVLYSSAYND